MRQSFPFHHQLDAADCGPACLKMILASKGREVSLALLRDACHIDRDGVSLQGIADAAEAQGLRASGVICSLDDMVKEAPMPLIAHWRGNHFIVVYDVKNQKGKRVFCIADPAVGLVEKTEDEFLKGWLSNDDGGIVMFFETTPEFYAKDDIVYTEKASKTAAAPRRGMKYILDYLRPYKKYLWQIFICLVTASLISMVFPFISQSIVDKGIGTGNVHLVVVLLCAQIFLLLGSLANSIIQGWLSLHLTTRIGISMISDFIAKLMRLPLGFFESKRVGDIIQRIGDHSRIQSFLTNYLMSMVVALVSILIYSIVMGYYSWKILAVFLIGSVLYVIWSVFFLRYRRKLDMLRFQEASANQGSIIQIIQGMPDIKLNGCARPRRWEWEEIQARLFKVSTKQLSVSQVQGTGASLIDELKNILISFLAAMAVIDGDMTLGMMTAMQFILGQLNAPVSQLVSFMQAAQDASISMERLGEIQEMEDEEPEVKEYIDVASESTDINVEHVSFSYPGSQQLALDDVSLTIPAGKVTAIVGASGSGKTTLVKLLLGFFQPKGGRILYGRHNLDAYSLKALRAQCGTVMQESYIFNGTIAMNIAPADDRPDMARVREAAGITNIDSWIDSLPLGYNTRIGADGNGLSSGQRQRIILSRAVYKKGAFLFLDEATNSLDAENEKIVMDNLHHFFPGRTVLIVAHRLSTVRDADKIVVLKGGKVVEEGTHEELSAKRGHYYKLVSNQLELGS